MVGPLFMATDNSVCVLLRGDFLKTDHSIMDWLHSKLPSSVVYISFSRVVHLKQEEVNEIAHDLLDSGLSFLSVMNPPHKRTKKKKNDHVLPYGFADKSGNKGKVVQWCLQEQVLGHPSMACFMTHCGWNLSMEALSFGVPFVAFPQ
ncbi:hypothetical protein Fmac_010987 [Flemingia macrophylla]|uniref:Uncharacterized protein n=1 Tax=Flemingia macrophylla TaxID=520843 RepID=A0ABD1MLF0_9FABA